MYDTGLVCIMNIAPCHWKAAQILLQGTVSIAAFLMKEGL